MEQERHSGESEPLALQPLPPSAPCRFVDALIFPTELMARKADIADATQAAVKERGSSAPPSGLIERVAYLGGPNMEAAIGCYWESAEMDATAGDTRFRAWDSHDDVHHATFGLEPRGIASFGAAISAAIESAEHAPDAAPEARQEAARKAAESAAAELPLLQTLVEAWAEPRCMACGPFGLDYAADDLSSPSQRTNQRLGLALLLKAAVATGHPIYLTARGGAAAEKDTSAAAVTALRSAAAAASAGTPRVPRPRACGTPWRECTPLICWDAGGLWSRLHAAWPHSAWCVFDGSLTFTKAPRELLDLAFDVPLERILLASAAPRCLPAQAGGAGVRRSVCHPGHIIHVAERLAALKRMEAPLDAMPSPALMGAAASMQSASVTPTGELMPPPPTTTTVAAAEGVKVTPQRGHVVGPVEFCLAAARENARIVFPELRLKAIDVTPKAERQQPPLPLPQELHPPRQQAQQQEALVSTTPSTDVEVN